MILFYGEGRLGNQVFQYQALTQVAKLGERIIAVGLEDLDQSFELKASSVTVLTRSRLIKRVVKYVILPLLLRPLSRYLKLFGYGHETQHGSSPNTGASGELKVGPGFFSRMTLIDGGYYQNASFWPSRFPATTLKVIAAQTAAARRYLNSICPEGRISFIHVRRGDYLTHSDYGLSDLSLPATYYRVAINELALRVGNTHLLFVTDDPKWVEENFKDINKSIATFDARTDFAIMTECDSAILSNSTFSMAAALMLKSPDLVIAPMYWIGFRVGRWYPPKICFEHPKLAYLPADA